MLSVVLVALLVMAALGGCKKNVGTPEDNAVTETEDVEEEEAGYLFGYSGGETENPYFATLELSIRKEVESQGNRLMSRDPGNDPQLQNEQIMELIDEGIKALFLSPIDAEQIQEGLEALEEADIPVINIDTQIKESDLVDAFVGSDNEHAGYVCGEDLKKQLPNGGKIIILESSSRSSVNQRITGFEEAIANSGFEVLNRTDVVGDKQTAKEAVARLLTEYSEIHAVMCGSDPVALGALEAVEEAGRSGIYIYGVDGSPEVKKKLAENNQTLIGTGAQSPINIGKQAVKTAIAILEKEDYKEVILEDTFLINRDNVELYGTDGWQ